MGSLQRCGRVVAGCLEAGRPDSKLCDPVQVALQCAAEAVSFYLKQQALQADYKENRLNKKISNVQEACRKKLEEVHNGYQNVSVKGWTTPCQLLLSGPLTRVSPSKQAKRKYTEAMQQKATVEQENQELQQKYSVKAS